MMNEHEVFMWQSAMVFTLKMTCLILGFLTVWLGYLLIKNGVQGNFKFTSEYKGIKGGLVSSSPGLLFVLLGVALVGYSIYVEKPLNFKHDINGKREGTVPNPPNPHTIDSLIIDG